MTLLQTDTSVERFQAAYPFPLDDFQVQAVEALAAGRSVLVAAPTGTGKTVVAEYAVRRALENGRRTFYTTPIKALSNQKYRDFKAAFGEERHRTSLADMANVAEVTDCADFVQRLA